MAGAAVDKDFAEDDFCERSGGPAVLCDVAKRRTTCRSFRSSSMDSYWIHFHTASAEVKAAAIEVKAIIDSDAEYGVYKTLVGFEGIFGDWTKDRKDESFTLGSQDSRVKQSKVLAAQVPADGFEVWRARILRFAQTESNDLATFPVFYEFLAEVAASYPDFGLELLTQHADPLSRVLIPLLRGVWDGDRKTQLLPLMTRWIDEASEKETSLLSACARVFLSTKDVDFEILEKILEKATRLRDVFVIRQVATVAVGRSDSGAWKADLKTLFLRALPRLTELGDAGWVREIWYRKEATEIVGEFSPDERREVLKNLRLLPQIDYQAEDVLAAIAERELVWLLSTCATDSMTPTQLSPQLLKRRATTMKSYRTNSTRYRTAFPRTRMRLSQRSWTATQLTTRSLSSGGQSCCRPSFLSSLRTSRQNLFASFEMAAKRVLNLFAGVLRAYGGEAFISLLQRNSSSGCPEAARSSTR